MKARLDRRGNPFELALAVMAASHAITAICEKSRLSLIPRDEVDDALDFSLKDFLVPDWRRAGGTCRSCATKLTWLPEMN